jgi:tetratricopeptide (TPR) repeat protein
LLLDSQSSWAWRQSARTYKVQGDREMAYGAYLEAVRSNPLSRIANLELAVMYVEDDRHQLAIPYLEQLRRLGPDGAVGSHHTRNSCHRASLEMLIQCYEKEGDSAKLELVLKEAGIFYPNHIRIEGHLAQPSTNAPGQS